MNYSKLSAVALGAALAYVVAAPAMATTAVSGSMNIAPFAMIGGSTVQQASNSSWSATPTALSIAASASNSSPDSSISTFAAGSANWTSADAGSVTFSNYGWNIVTDLQAPQPESANMAQSGSNPDWAYTFTATQNGVFTMTYNVVGSGQTFGLWGWTIDWSGPGGGLALPGSAAYTPNASGTFTRALTAGQTYTVDLANNANIDVGSGGSFAGSMNGQFDWSIAAGSTGPAGVPEPAAWAVMLSGMFGCGAAIRRRRAMVTA